MLKKLYKKTFLQIRKNLIFIFLSSLIFIVWHKILFQYFMQEGAMYVAREVTTNFGYDLGASLLFKLLTSIFYDNMFLYQAFILVTFMFISMFFYQLVYKISDNKVIAVTSVILFSLNYSGVFSMLAEGNLENYAQRVVYFLFLFPSLGFFIQFLKDKRKSLFIYSLVLYTTAIFLGEYTIYFLFFFFTYFLCYIFFNKKSFQEIIKLSLYTLFFPLVTVVMLYLDQIYGFQTLSIANQSFVTFLFNDSYDVYYQTMKQFVLLTIPEQIIKGTLKYLAILFNYQGFVNIQKDINVFFIPVAGIYLSAIILVAKLKRKFLTALIASFLYIPLVFILNLYMRKDVILTFSGQNRYLFGPSIGFAIFWAIVLYVLFYKRFNKILFLFILAIWAFINVRYSWEDINRYFYVHTATKISMNYIKSISSKFSDDSIVIVPSVLGPYNSDAARFFYGKKTMFFEPYYSNWEIYIRRPFNPNKDFIIIYDYKKGIIDRTKDINKILDERKRGIYP